MKKNFTLTAIAVVFFNCYNAQVGVNTQTPKATLDVIGDASNAAKLDGIIAPRITGDLLRAKTSYGTDQNGAIVYVTAADSAPAGQTVDVLSEGYYYFSFPANKWIKMGGGSQSNDWHVTGNTEDEISTTTEVLGSAPASANFLGTKSPSDDLVVVTGGATHAVLDSKGNLKGGNKAANASIAWGNNNAVNGTASNIALGKDNTATGSGNFLSTAIGTGNIPSGGATAIGFKNGYSFVDGGAGDIAQVLSGTGSYAIGRYNYGNAGFSFGFSNNTSGGWAIGSGLKVSSNGFAFGGTNNPASTPPEAFGTGSMYIGVAGGLAKSGFSLYSNASHIFSSDTDAAGNALAGSSVVGINITPPTDKDGGGIGNPRNEADLYLNKGLNINASTGTTISPTNTTLKSECNSNTEGNIIYWLNTSTNVGNFYGCRRNGASTFVWQPF
ncbi:hypothetical protein LUD75_02570 [Epilithonimonas sp. JDS]|uniref:hypothetical protein n=1 Tax=Epilithonimonas sp. JDS TaxID=2902797 RepID=UPI001E425BB4|nr:hypothetical protein [Epilithonimonas sp. JDS]MCD9853575.1 hypothetical protein [Epilithonimonas sp. JDS]